MKLYTIILNEYQMQIMLMALERFSQYWLGHTGQQFEDAGKFYRLFATVRPGANDLTK